MENKIKVMRVHNLDKNTKLISDNTKLSRHDLHLFSSLIRYKQLHKLHRKLILESDSNKRKNLHFRILLSGDCPELVQNRIQASLSKINKWK